MLFVNSSLHAARHRECKFEDYPLPTLNTILYLPVCLSVCLPVYPSVSLVSLCLPLCLISVFFSIRLPPPTPTVNPPVIVALCVKGVTKHGGAWARLAQKHTELGVVAVEDDEDEDGAHASRGNTDGSEHIDDGRDGDGGGGDKPRTSLAGPAGEGTKQSGKKARKGGDKGCKGKDKIKKKGRRGSSEWDDEEHERFVKVNMCFVADRS